MFFNTNTYRSIFFTLAVSAVLSLMVAFSGYYDIISSDAIIVYLAGILRWTPFYWGQDRYGMLIPALTLGISDPLFNMIAQNTLHMMTSFLSFFLLARFFFPRSYWREIGAGAIFIYIALNTLPDIKPFLSPWQIYTPAMMFGVAALLVANQSLALSFVLALLAQYCNFSVVIFLGILSVSRTSERGGREGWQKVLPDGGRELLILAISAVISYFIRRPYSAPTSGYSVLDWHEALTGWLMLLQDYYVTLSSMWMLLLPPALGIAALLYFFVFNFERLKENTEVLRSFVMGQFVLFTYAMIVGASIFAKWNGFPKRYLIPSLMIWSVIWLGLVLHLFFPKELPLRKNQRQVGALAMLVLLVLVRFGAPSMQAVQSSLITRFAPTHSQVDKSCTHIAGDYYRVWDVMFFSMLLKEPQVWGITYRSQVIHDLWDLKNYDKPRVCYWKNNEQEALQILNSFRVTGLTQVDSRDGLVFLDGQPKFALGR